MPRLTVPGAELAYGDRGDGLPVIALHGFSETGDYWTTGGFADALGPGLRLLTMDLRGHGETRETGAVTGYDIDTLADDIDRIAQGLGLSRYAVLAHATGSVIALRHAMRRPAGLVALVVTSGASASAMASSDPVENAAFFERMAGFYGRHDWPDILPRLRRNPRPFLHRLDHAPDPEAAWAVITRVFRANDPSRLSDFVRGVYVDPDPRRAGLRQIAVPTLVVTAEHDELMTASERILLDEIPGVSHVSLAGVGHMTAIECPDRLASAVNDFLASRSH